MSSRLFFFIILLYYRTPNCPHHITNSFIPPRLKGSKSYAINCCFRAYTLYKQTENRLPFSQWNKFLEHVRFYHRKFIFISCLAEFPSEHIVSAMALDLVPPQSVDLFYDEKRHDKVLASADFNWKRSAHSRTREIRIVGKIINGCELFGVLKIQKVKLVHQFNRR